MNPAARAAIARGLPYLRTPPVAWWDLWPAGAKAPNTESLIDGRNVLNFPLLGHLDVFAAGETKSKYVQLTDMGWTWRLYGLVLCGVQTGDPATLSDNGLTQLWTITITDESAGKTLVKNAAPSAFAGGEFGKSLCPFQYQLAERNVLRFDFTNLDTVSRSLLACAVGTNIRGAT